MRFLLFVFIVLPFSLDAQQGYIQVTTNLDNFYLVLNHDYENVALYKRNDKIPAEVGFNHVRLIWEGMNDFEDIILIQEDQVFEIRPVIDFDEFPDKSSLSIVRNYRNLSIYTDEQSEIYINNTYLGTGLVSGMLNPGVYEMKIVHPKRGVLEKELIVRQAKYNEIFRFNEDPNQIIKPFRILPGFGYYANGEVGKAATTWMATSILVFNVWVQNRSYERAQNNYDELVLKYDNETRADRFTQLRSDIDAQIDRIDERRIKLNTSIIATGLFYAFTTYRGFQKPKRGYGLIKKRDKNKIRLTYQQKYGVPVASIQFKRSF